MSFFGGSSTPLSLLTKSFLEPCRIFLKKNDQIIPEYQNKPGFYTPFIHFLTVSVITHITANPRRLQRHKIEGYDDLLNPKLKGKSLLLIQVTFSSALLTNKHACDQGGYENEQAWTYVKNLFS